MKTNAYQRLKHLADLGLGAPLDQLRRELGHRPIITTMRYLHLTDEMRARINSEHQNLIVRIDGRSVKLPGQ